MAFPFKRVIVIGTTGSGKSTLAEQIAKKYDLDFIELDAIHWLPEWKALNENEFRRQVDAATNRPGWVIAGNYHVVRDVSWPKAEAVIWLDYPLWTIFWRLLRRTLLRWWEKELLWGTNREKLWPQLKIWSAEDSLFHWLFKTYWRRKREYPLLFNAPENKHLQIFRMRTPQETASWLESFSN